MASERTARELLAAIKEWRHCVGNDALSRQLRIAGSWDRAGFCIDGPQGCGGLSTAARRSIDLALLLNDQVRDNENALALIEQEKTLPA